MSTHMQLTVRLADHQTAHPDHYLRHAQGTFDVVLAYIEPDSQGQPAQASDGTYRVHAPSWSTLDTLRMMIAHEGMTIEREDEVPGDGIIIAY